MIKTLDQPFVESPDQPATLHWASLGPQRPNVAFFVPYAGQNTGYQSIQQNYANPWEQKPAIALLTPLPHNVGGQGRHGAVLGAMPALYSMAHGFEAPTGPRLTDYSFHLNQLRDDINSLMNPLQRHAARVLNVAGTLLSVGGAVAVGILGMTALGSAASGVGMPVAAAAAIAGALVGLGGLLLSQVLSTGVRKMVRKNIRKDPQLAERLMALRHIRDALAAKPNLTKDEKVLLQNVKKVLGKVDGFGASFRAQVKTSAKTLGIIPATILVLGRMVLEQLAKPFSSFTTFQGGIGLSTSTSPQGHGDTTIDLHDGHRSFDALANHP